MNLFDFKIKFICKYDNTFWLHLLREFIITFVLSWINIYFAIGVAFGTAVCWEWQDGLKGYTCEKGKLIIEGFNWVDFLAGCIGIGIALIIRGLI